MIQDFRYALRILRRNRVATVAVLTLGLGIGAVTVMYAVVEAVLLRPLPFRDPDGLVRIWELTRDGDRFSFSEPRLVLREGLTVSVVGVAAGTIGALAVTRILKSLLYEVDPTDPITYALVATGLLICAALACYLPARQAASVDPVAVLRAE